MSRHSPIPLRHMLPAGMAFALATLACCLLRPGQRRQAPTASTGVASIRIDQQHNIEQANAAAASLFGYSTAAMRGQPLERFILRDLRSLHTLQAGNQDNPHDDEDDNKDDSQAGLPFGDMPQQLRLTGRRSTDYSLVGMRQDGSTFPLEGSLSACRLAGQRSYTVGVRDISARKQVHEQLARSFLQLRELSGALQGIREEERRHIARELHDDLGQLLATLRGDLTLMQRHAQMNVPLQNMLHGMDGLLVTAITSLRRIASNLRPRALDEGGLFFALQSLRQDFLQRQPMRFDLLADEDDLVLDDAHSTAIYRIVQEALTNIARHAEASQITVALHRVDSELAITIQDNGRGLAAGDLEKVASMGLLGMRERVWSLDGSIEIGADSEQGGTRIDIMLPLDNDALVQQTKKAPEGASDASTSQK